MLRYKTQFCETISSNIRDLQTTRNENENNSVPSLTRILHLENFHGASDLNAKPDAITFSIALALIYNTISKTTRRQITRGRRRGRKDKKCEQWKDR